MFALNRSLLCPPGSSALYLPFCLVRVTIPAAGGRRCFHGSSAVPVASQQTRHRIRRRRAMRNPSVRRFLPNTSRISSVQSPSTYDEDDSSWPSIQTAKAMATCYRSMDNTTLVTLSHLGVHKARVEVLIRHIMAVDEVNYFQARETFAEIKRVNHEGMYLLGLPFQIAVATSLVAGMASIPMVFYLPTVEFVNSYYVTAERPPLEDLETALEVGSWSWMWMEPLLGVSTFVLLCLQYMRIHLNHLGFKPYTHRLKRFRGERLARTFPQYDRRILILFSHSATIYDRADDTPNQKPLLAAESSSSQPSSNYIHESKRAGSSQSKL